MPWQRSIRCWQWKERLPKQSDRRDLREPSPWYFFPNPLFEVWFVFTRGSDAGGVPCPFPVIGQRHQDGTGGREAVDHWLAEVPRCANRDHYRGFGTVHKELAINRKQPLD